MDVFDLSAKLSLDSKDYDRSLQNASSAADQWATKFAMAAKAVSAAVSSVSKAITGIIDQSTKAYGEYEQLTGGIKKLFGTGGQSFEDWSKSFDQSSNKLQDYADIARKVLNGDFGIGSERKDLLAAAGYDPDAVQQMVNNLINGVDIASGLSADAIASNMQTAEEKYESLQRAQQDMIYNAQQAFRTSGMSANEYIKNVTGFSAALINSLGGDTEKAAAIADMAMQDVADNANTYGVYTAQELAGVYQALAKGQYQTLDNLSLGFKGTKEGVEQLIKKANELKAANGETADLSVENFADIVEAIHLVQKDMGIAGTTADEAAGTIQGSTIKMKKAWENMLTAMVTGGEWFDESIEGLVESVNDYVRNMLPAIEGAMKGFAALVSQLAPLLAEKLPGFVEEVLPDFIDAVKSIISGILTALPGLLEAVTESIPTIIAAVNDLVPDLIDFILESIPLVIDAGITLLTSLVNGMADNVETIVPQLTQGIIDMVDRIGEIVDSGSVDFADAGLKLLTNLSNALVEAVPNVLTQITQMIQDLTARISEAAEGEDGNFLETAVTILKSLAGGLVDSVATVLPELTSAMAEFITQFAGLAAENTAGLANAAIDILNSLVTSLGDAGTISKVAADITTAVMAIIEAIVNVITGLDVVTFANACASIVGQLADGIVSAVGVITEKLPELITELVAWLTNPDNLFGIADAALTIFGELVSKIPAIIESLASGLAQIVTGIAKYFTDNKEEILTGIADGFSGLLEKVESIWTEKIKPAFEELGKKFKDWLSKFEWGQAVLDFVDGIKTALGKAWDNLKDAFTGASGFAGKVAEWFKGIDLIQAAQNFIGKIKSAVDEGWESVKTWFSSKITGLFDNIEIPDWLNPKNWFGGGKDKKENVEGENVEEDSGMTVDMPENMLTLDYDNLQPIPDATLETYQTLRDAIEGINTAIGGSEDSPGLSMALSTLPEVFGEIQTSSENLAGYWNNGFTESVMNLEKMLAQISVDDEGNISAEGGNTLYNSLGAISGVFEDIDQNSKRVADTWKGTFKEAVERLKKIVGEAIGVLKNLASNASKAGDAFGGLASQIRDAIAALQEFNGLDVSPNPKGKSFNNRQDLFKAEGGAVHAGQSYIVGEEGWEVFSPTRDGYIIPHDQVSGNGMQVVVNFNGDVIGDEQSVSDYVTKAAKEAIWQEVYVAA